MATTATTTLESEILKRNTDCVYFLASPLTCKKGSECEYRHSDIARLNPRDCWYWLSGNCLNPTCAFRHPPLEGLTEILSSSGHLTCHSAGTTSKTNVPCYFYFNTYCMKGDQCPFSHVMDDISHAQKIPKIAPEAGTCHLPVNMACTESEAGPTAVDVPANFTNWTSNPKELISETLAKDVDNTVLNNASDEPCPSRESPDSSNPDSNGPIVKSPDNLCPEDKYTNGGEDLFSEHSSEEPVKDSSEELVKDRTEAEEWWESSPGFDVLVDDVSEQLAYEDDADYLQVRERESERLHNQLMHYDYEDSAAYVPVEYQDGGFMEHCLYDAYEHFSDGYAPDYAKRVHEPSGERRLDTVLPRKRRSSRAECKTEQHGVDLRDHLRKRRRMDVHRVSQNSRTCRPYRIKLTSQERPERHGVHPAYQHTLSSELGREFGGNNIRESYSDAGFTLDESHRRGGRLGYPYFGRPIYHSRNSESLTSLDDYPRRTGRLCYRDFGRPLVHSRRRESRGRRGRRDKQSSLPKGLAIEARPRPVPVTGFTRHKTQRHVQKEKTKVQTGRYGSEDLPGQHRSIMSSDFEGPKSLSELLKDKRKLTSVKDSRDESTADYETTEQPERSVQNVYNVKETRMHHYGAADRFGGVYKSDCLHDAEDDDDDDDDDDLAKKVAGILA